MKKATVLPLLKGSKARILFSNNLLIFIMLCSALSTSFSQNVGINGTGATPDPKALLDVDAAGMSTKGGLLIPRMNTAERNTLSGGGSMTESLLIYNTTTHCFEAWNETTLGWVAFGCINCHLPTSFSATSATNVGCTSFAANWSVSDNATGYYLDVSTSSDFTSFVSGFANLPVSNVVTYAVTNLPPNVTYYYRVRAVNDCGTTNNSNTITVTVIPILSSTISAGCHPCQVEADYGASVTYISKTWITRNLGASAQASSATDISNAAAGCYYQFNRAQSYGLDNGLPVNPAWTITDIIEDSDWTAANDPCALQLGGQWRLPTYTEWTDADVFGGWTSYTNSFGSVLKLHLAGTLEFLDGSIYGRGSHGDYWSSTQHDNAGWDLTIDTTYDTYVGSGGIKAYGMNVRCLK